MKILRDSQSVLHQHSPLNRGQWTFTSLISSSSDFLYLNKHLERLTKGADFLFPQVGWLDESKTIKDHMITLFAPHTYYRINICEDFLWVYQKPLMQKSMSVKMTLAQSRKAVTPLPSYLKIPNYLVADKEVEIAQKNGYEEVLFLDDHFNIAEASTSSLFYVSKSGFIYTPPLSSVVLQGVMRDRVIECLKKCGFSVLENEAAWDQGKWLDSVQEMWLTNSVSGLRFVEVFGDRKFNYKESILSTFLKKFDRYGVLYE